MVCQTQSSLLLVAWFDQELDRPEDHCPSDSERCHFITQRSANVTQCLSRQPLCMDRSSDLSGKGSIVHEAREISYSRFINSALAVYINARTLTIAAKYPV